MLQTQNQILQILNQRFPNSKTIPKSEEREFSMFFFYLGIKNIGNQENLICLCSSSFFLSKETCYWLVQALSITQYIVQPDTQPRVTILMENWREILYTYTQYIRVYVYTYIYTLW